MNTPYYLEFLNWQMNTGADGILEKKLSTLLESTEVQGLLRILSIIHISVALPARWLGGKTQMRKMTYSSSCYYFNMGKYVDLMEEACLRIANEMVS